MSQLVRRLAGSIAVLVAVVAVACYPSLQAGRLEQQKQEQVARELEQRLAMEMQANSYVRHIGELFPHGR